MLAQRRLRGGAGLALMLGLALVLTGCMRVERTLVFNADGSGVYTLTIGFRQPTPGDPTSVPQQDVAPMEAFGAHVQQTGGSYRRVDDATYSYWTFTRPFASAAQANALVQEDPRQYDPNHYPVLYRDTLHVTAQAGLFATTLHVTGTISLVDVLNNATNWRDATESVAITMPQGISAHQGGTLEGNTVTYTIHYNESAHVDVAGRVRKAPSDVTATALLIAEGALAVLAVVLLGLGGRVLYRATRKPGGPA